MGNNKRKMEQIKKQKHDYLMKVENNEDGWKTIKQMRENAKKCGSSYKLVLRGSKPKTPWGWRKSIPLDDAQQIRIYIRPKDNVSYENPRAYDGIYDGLVQRNRDLMDELQKLQDRNYELRVRIGELNEELQTMKEGLADTRKYLLQARDALTKWNQSNE